MLKLFLIAIFALAVSAKLGFTIIIFTMEDEKYMAALVAANAKLKGLGAGILSLIDDGLPAGTLAIVGEAIQREQLRLLQRSLGDSSPDLLAIFGVKLEDQKP